MPSPRSRRPRWTGHRGRARGSRKLVDAKPLGACSANAARRPAPPLAPRGRARAAAPTRRRVRAGPPSSARKDENPLAADGAPSSSPVLRGPRSSRAAARRLPATDPIAASPPPDRVPRPDSPRSSAAPLLSSPARSPRVSIHPSSSSATCVAAVPIVRERPARGAPARGVPRDSPRPPRVVVLDDSLSDEDSALRMKRRLR